jgi:hypothetical protein
MIYNEFGNNHEQGFEFNVYSYLSNKNRKPLSTFVSLGVT